jgi:hypothetical protein
MPFQMQVLPEAELARVEARGVIGFESSIDAMRELAAREDFRPTFRVLADFRGVKYTPSFADLSGFLSAFKEIRAAYQNRLAVVVQGAVHRALGVTACGLGRLVRFQMRCFSDLGKAEAWLDEIAPSAS